MEKRLVYADNAATTRISETVFDAMLPYLKDQFGNPSSIHTLGRSARKAVEEARCKLASAIGCEPAEIYFTCSGTESSSWALQGFVSAASRPEHSVHIITSSIEHHSILNTCEALRKKGCHITYIQPDALGRVPFEDVKSAVEEILLTENTGPERILVTIMTANNEIGTLQPVEEVARWCRQKGILFHTDGVSAFGQVPMHPADSGISMISLSGHKIHGPKGVGALYISRNCKIDSLLYGGAQERDKRAGTENTAGIVAFGEAAAIAVSNIAEKNTYIAELRDRLAENLLAIPGSRINGILREGLKNKPENSRCLPGMLNITFEGVENESLILALDREGICVSGGSACASGAIEPSHVLKSIGLSHEDAGSSIRISLNEENTEEDIAYIFKHITQIINRLRAPSPF